MHGQEGTLPQELKVQEASYHPILQGVGVSVEESKVSARFDCRDHFFLFLPRGFFNYCISTKKFKGRNTSTFTLCPGRSLEHFAYGGSIRELQNASKSIKKPRTHPKISNHLMRSIQNGVLRTQQDAVEKYLCVTTSFKQHYHDIRS